MCDYYLIKSESLSSRKCQCCLSENNLKTMIDIYSEMIKKCFGLMITDDKSTGYFICDVCILRLRDSYNFRNQVDRVQSKLNKKNEEDSTLDTSLTHPYPTGVEVSDMLENDAKENIAKQEYSSEDEFRFCVEIKPLESEESKCVLENTTKKLILLPKINKGKLRKIEKPSILTEQDDEPSNEDYCIDNVIINSKSGVRHTGRKRSEEEFKECKRRYQMKHYAKSIPYKLDKTDISCKICKETFTSNANLVKHMPEHYGNLVCHICGKFALSARKLSNHLRTHAPEKVACNICNKVVKKASMRRHVWTHTGDNYIYPCEECPEKFTSYSTRINHMANVHQVEVLKHKCKICPKAFRISGYLSTHMRKFHLKERNHPCPECGKPFFHKREMQRHMVRHTRVKNVPSA